MTQPKAGDALTPSPAAPQAALKRARAFVNEHRKPLGMLAVVAGVLGLRSYVNHVRRDEFRHGYRAGWADRGEEPSAEAEEELPTEGT